MASPAGFAGQVGLVAESVYGTYVAPARHEEFVSEDINLAIARIESKGIRAGRRVLLSGQWAPGKRSVAGNLTTEMHNLGQGLIWKHALGAVSSSGLVDSAYTHTFTPADLSALSLAVQVGRPDITGTVQPFSYTGVVINGWDLSCKAGDIPILKFDLLGQNEVTSQALSTATYPAGLVPMTFVQGVLNVGGSALDVMDVDVKGTNGLGGDRYFINGGALRKQPLENAQREYTGTFTCDFSGLTAYNRFTGGTEAALTLTFTGGLIGVSSHYTLQITGNVRFDGSTPNVKDMSTLDLQAPFKFVASGAADSSAISVLLTTTEVTP